MTISEDIKRTIQELDRAKGRPTIVCLCGSTRFSEAYRRANLTETMAGKIVLSIGIDTKSDADLLLAGELTQADKDRLDELHLRKIELADEVLFLNVGGYLGESSLREHLYASLIGRTIRYLEKPEESNRYYVEASNHLAGLKALIGLASNQGITLVNRRAWFPDQ